MVRPRQFIEPGLGVPTYFYFGARLFSTHWPPYGASYIIVRYYLTAFNSAMVFFNFLKDHHALTVRVRKLEMRDNLVLNQ